MPPAFYLNASAILLTVLATACAPLNRNELQAEMTKHAVHVSEPYQSVYRRILGQARNCHQASGFFGPSQIVQNELYTDTHTANVSLLGADSGVIYSIDIKADTPDTTTVSYYVDERYPRSSAPIIQSWIAGKTECRI